MKNKILLSEEILRDIAQNLQMGMKCWYHVPTGEVLSAPDDMRHDYDEELWQNIFNDINKKKNNCIVFECLETLSEFRIMQSFAGNEVNDMGIEAALIHALNHKKPFRHFKAIIDSSPYREAWFKYRDECYISYIQDIVNQYNSDKEAKAEDEQWAL